MKLNKIVCATLLLGLVSLVTACGASVDGSAELSPEEARAIAKEAYVYGFPLVDGYRILHAYNVDRDNPEYKGPWNQISNVARVFTPDDTAVQGPNSDTPYSFLALDLRTEPLLLTVPVIESERYFSIQLIDLYTHNFDYIGSRTTGNDGGNFLIAGPGWSGVVPDGIERVFHSETQLMLAVYRTQLFAPDDIDKVKRIPAGYGVRPLSACVGETAPEAAAAIDFIEPLTAAQQRSSLEFFNILNFTLQFTPTHPSETELMARFEKLGVSAGKIFDANQLTPELQAAIGQGIADAWAEFAELIERGEVTSADVFGTREHLQNNYLYRMGAAVMGIWGNSTLEALYPSYEVDADGQKPIGSHRYSVRFAPGQLPPVHAFWSMTMYELPANLLSANSLDRYLLNSTMLPQFKRDADGGITFYIQHESPGADMESNWLPAPKGEFRVVARLYWPKPEALDGTWVLPPLLRE
jgi:hypothetical protein